MIDKNLESELREEIENLHIFFAGWFSGQLPKESFEEGFIARFNPEFLLIPPAGTLLTLQNLQATTYKNHGMNPAIRLAIRNVKVQRVFNHFVLATYEEWQRNAVASTPPNNARIATVLFEKKKDRLDWLHIHETWMPDEIATKGPYDF